MTTLSRKITTPGWVKGRTLYEVNLRQYTRGGTFVEFQAHLPRLKEMGVGILWFMPIQPIGIKNRKGSLGSYYSISNYTAVNPEFGNLDQFKSLVAEAHKLDMKVIIDWVANHTAWDHHWTIDHPDFYTKDAQGNFKAPVEDWEDVIHLDYGNPGLWDEMIGQMTFWLKETDIDGFRCDMAHLVPTLYWNRARRDLDRVRPVFMLAESENHDLLEYGFDAIYNWKFLHAANDLAAGRTDAFHLLNIALNELGFMPPGTSLLNFTSNHDENSWQGSAIERIHYFLEPMTVLTFLLPGIPLVYSGQEAGNYRRLKFFDKDQLDWKDDKMFRLYRVLAGLVKSIRQEEEEPVVKRIENDKAYAVATFELTNGKNRVLAFVNLSGMAQTFFIKCGNYKGTWKDAMTGNSFDLDCRKPQALDAYSFLILQ